MWLCDIGILLRLVCRRMIRLKAPGRICLFGEHMDYLDYPVISMAISKYIYLEAERITEAKFNISLPDINSYLEIPLINKELEYSSNRDYIRSAYNIFLRKSIKFYKGYKIKITGDIPINAGVASSSAMVIAWLSFLNIISGNSLNKYQIASEGYNTEVAEFGEAGGKMDFFTSTYGNLIYLESRENNPNVIEIPVKLEGFVLGNSLEKKETVEDLRRVKILSLEAFKRLREIIPTFDEFNTPLEEIKPFLQSLNKEHQEKIVGNIINRDITSEAKGLILKNRFRSLVNSKKNISFYKQLGNLLNKHEDQLKNMIKITTEKIDNMISECIELGAYGAKINGSGFGGTMFALAPGKESIIKDAIEKLEGEAYLINTSNGIEHY